MRGEHNVHTHWHVRSSLALPARLHNLHNAKRLPAQTILVLTPNAAARVALQHLVRVGRHKEKVLSFAFDAKLLPSAFVLVGKHTVAIRLTLQVVAIAQRRDDVVLLTDLFQAKLFVLSAVTILAKGLPLHGLALQVVA